MYACITNSKESFTPGPDREKDLLRSVFKLLKLGPFIQQKAGFLYRNEISSVLYSFGGDSSWPALPCERYKPVHLHLPGVHQ